MRERHVCAYCGMPADSVDHLVPQSLVETARLSGNPDWVRDICRVRILTVEACRQCNGVLGNRIFPTLEDRKRAVKRYLRRKYRRLLKAPPWEDDELEEMGLGLRGYIARQQAERETAQARVQF